MNEETKKAMDALAGGGKNESADTDWKAKYEEMERKLQSAQVEQGRVKKLAEEKKELEAKLAELSAGKTVQDALSALPEDVRSDIPENYATASSAIARQAVDSALASRDQELNALRAQIEERDRRDFAVNQQKFSERLEREFPGFLATAVAEGGDKHQAWVGYQRYNAASIKAAVNSFDFDALAWHIRKFYADELGIEPPSGNSGRAAPDPGSIGGGKPTTPKAGKVYTEAEISELYDKVEAARDRGDFKEVQTLGHEIEVAIREGRVKAQ